MELVGGKGRTNDEVIAAMQEYTNGMRVHLKVLDAYCAANGIK